MINNIMNEHCLFKIKLFKYLLRLKTVFEHYTDGPEFIIYHFLLLELSSFFQQGSALFDT